MTTSYVPPPPLSRDEKLTIALTAAKIKYYEAKAAYYEKLSNPLTKVSLNGQADQKASS